ncbi:MAG: hypothetical protein AAGH15_06040 [Myxococcota bacterium]
MRPELRREAHRLRRRLQLRGHVPEEEEGAGRRDLEQVAEVRRRGLAQVEAEGVGVPELVART